MTRVLVVDDTALNRLQMQQILAAHDYDVVGEAGDGLEAVEAFKALQPDLVIMDLVMPKEDGVSACRRMLQIRPDAKVIAVSSLAVEAFVQIAEAAGVSGYIMKPFDVAEFIAVVRQVTETCGS